MHFRFEGLASIFRNFSYLAAGHLGTLVIRLLYLMILVRWLSPADYGKLSYGMAWYLAFIVLTYLGQDIVLSRGIGRGLKQPKKFLNKTLRQRWAAIGVVAVVSIMAAVISEHDADMLWILLIFTLAMGGRSLWIWSAWCFTALERAKYAVALDLIFRPAEVLCVLALVLIDEPSILGIAAIHAASWCVQGLLGTIRARKAVSPHGDAGLDPSMNLLRDGAAGAIYAFGLTWFLQAPVLLFRHFVDSGPALGHFALAFQIIGYLQVIPYLLGAAALPVLSRSAARKDGKDRVLALGILAATPVVGGILAALMAAVTRPLVTLLFGEAYGATAAMLAVGLWLLIPLGLAVLLQQFTFAATRQTPLGVLAPLAGVIVMTLLYPSMIADQGYQGAVIATGVGMTVWAGLVLTSLWKTGFFKPRSVA